MEPSCSAVSIDERMNSYTLSVGGNAPVLVRSNRLCVPTDSGSFAGNCEVRRQSVRVPHRCLVLAVSRGQPNSKYPRTFSDADYEGNSQIIGHPGDREPSRTSVSISSAIFSCMTCSDVVLPESVRHSVIAQRCRVRFDVRAEQKPLLTIWQPIL